MQKKLSVSTDARASAHNANQPTAASPAPPVTTPLLVSVALAVPHVIVDAPFDSEQAGNLVGDKVFYFSPEQMEEIKNGIFFVIFLNFFCHLSNFFLVKQESQLDGARASIQPASVSSPSTSLPALTLSNAVESASTEILATVVQVGGTLRFYRPVS